MKRCSELIEKRRKFINDYIYKNYDKPIKENILTLANDILYVSPSTIWKDIYEVKHIEDPWRKI